VNTDQPDSFSSPHLPVAAETCWTRERLELKKWLARNAPSLAELYEGSVRLLFELRLPGYSRFVAHAVREIGNRLPFVISGSSSREQLQYKNRLDEIRQEWEKAGFPTDGTLAVLKSTSDSVGSRPPDLVLPPDLVHLFAKLIADHTRARERPRDTAERLFIGLQSENQKFKDALRPTITQWIEIIRWFVTKTHDNGSLDAELDGPTLRRNFELFEIALMAIEQQFFATTDALDEILEEANS
jgi:hypothetical protein